MMASAVTLLSERRLDPQRTRRKQSRISRLVPDGNTLRLAPGEIRAEKGDLEGHRVVRVGLLVLLWLANAPSQQLSSCCHISALREFNQFPNHLPEILFGHGGQHGGPQSGYW